MINHFSSLLKQDYFDRILLMIDVDGVVRDCVEKHADPRVIAQINLLLNSGKVDVVFISGTSIENESMKVGQSGNLPLNKLFGSAFDEEIVNGKVSIYGSLGAQKLVNGSVKQRFAYSSEEAEKIGLLLINAFLEEAAYSGNEEQRRLALGWLKDLNKPLEYWIDIIRIHLDEEFRLINRGALIETHTSNPPWNTKRSSKWLLNALSKIFSEDDVQIATGITKRRERDFNFLLVSKINKGKIVQELKENYKAPLIISIGDTEVDFPMHRLAHLAFHVGLKSEWEKIAISHCTLVLGENGEDRQQVEGTLKALKSIYSLVK